jgi:hypothetical protein
MNNNIEEVKEQLIKNLSEGRRAYITQFMAKICTNEVRDKLVKEGFLIDRENQLCRRCGNWCDCNDPELYTEHQYSVNPLIPRIKELERFLLDIGEAIEATQSEQLDWWDCSEVCLRKVDYAIALGKHE